MKIGITGGIGSGKSYVCRMLERYGIQVYDCDAAAKRLMRTQPALQERLRQLIGANVFTQEGQLDKAVVARFLLASQNNADALDAVIHPAVFTDFTESGMQWMESAIMFESGINQLVDRVVIVTAPEEVRIARIVKRDGITATKAREWMNRQWPQDKVRLLSHYEIVNDGNAPLSPQIEQLLNKIENI